MGAQWGGARCVAGPGGDIWSERSRSKCPPSGQGRLLPASHCKICQIPTRCGGVLMLDTEAFREFKQGLTLLRDDYALKALPHMRRAAELDKNNPYYMSYLGVVLARSEQKRGEAERLCDAAGRMKRNQAQLYLNLSVVYIADWRLVEALAVLEE